MPAVIQIKRTTTVNSPPPNNSLQPGELGIELANTAGPRLWVGTPTGIDATGRRIIYDPAAPSGAVTSLTAGTGITLGGTASAPTVGLTVPVTVTSGGTGTTSLAQTASTGAVLVSSAAADPIAAADSAILEASGALTLRFGGAAGVPILRIRRMRGTIAAPALVQSDDELGRLSFEGYFSATQVGEGPLLLADTTQAWSATQRGSRLRLFVTANNTTALQEALRIDQNRTVTAEGVLWSNSYIGVTAGGAGLECNRFSNAAADGATLHLIRSRGTTVGARTAVQANDTIGFFTMQGYSSPTVMSIGVLISGYANQNWTAAARGSRLEFSTVADGATTQRNVMTLGADGAITLPTYTASNTVWNQLGLDGALLRASGAGRVTQSHGNGGFVGSWNNAIVVFRPDATPQFGPYVALVRARGTLAAPTAVQNGDALGNIKWEGYVNATNVNRSGPGINALATQNWTAANNGCRLLFDVVSNNTNVVVAAMELQESGRTVANRGMAVVGTFNVGTFVSCSDANSWFRVSDVIPLTNNQWCGWDGANYWFGVASRSFVTVPSGRDAKKDIAAPPAGALDRVMRIHPYNYHLLPEPADYPLHCGFLAEEVHEVMGDNFAGYRNTKGNQGLNYNELMATLWQAVQELAAEVQRGRRSNGTRRSQSHK